MARERPPRLATGRQGPDEDPLVCGMTLHANPVTQEGTAGKRTRWIHGNNANRFSLFAENVHHLVDERGLARTRGTGDPNDIGFSRLGVELFEGLEAFRRSVLDFAHQPRSGPDVSF